MTDSVLNVDRTLGWYYNGQLIAFVGAEPRTGSDDCDDGRIDGDRQGAADWWVAREDGGSPARRSHEDHLPSGQHVGLAGAS